MIRVQFYNYDYIIGWHIALNKQIEESLGQGIMDEYFNHKRNL